MVQRVQGMEPTLGVVLTELVEPGPFAKRWPYQVPYIYSRNCVAIRFVEEAVQYFKTPVIPQRKYRRKRSTGRKLKACQIEAMNQVTGPSPKS
jgi:hypothetical protein